MEPNAICTVCGKYFEIARTPDYKGIAWGYSHVHTNPPCHGAFELCSEACLRQAVGGLARMTSDARIRDFGDTMLEDARRRRAR
jgi:hypothetical protein